MKVCDAELKTAADANVRAASSPPGDALQRQLDWKGAFWAASGVPAGVLLTIGGIASVIGQPSWVVWICSIAIGFIQAFVYAEIAGLYPNKSGGASIYGARAWLPYSKAIAPVSVWCNWLAWSPVLALGTSLGAGYVMASLFSTDAAINRWEIHLLSLDVVREGLTLRINFVSLIATGFLLVTFFLQHRGAARAASTQKLLAVLSLSPLLLVGLVPLVTGDVPSRNLFPLLPMIRNAAGGIQFGEWDRTGIILLMGAMFAAAWSTYGFETAVCYTREFRNPGRDTPRAIFASGVLCIVIFTLVPLAFQSRLGITAMLDSRIYDGSGVALAMAQIVGGGAVVANLMIAALILSLLLIVMTSMLGSSRTLYQASIDGWLPRYLSRVNDHGAPVAAMWTDLAFNLLLLLCSDYFAVLMISNVCYLIFNFLNLQAGWIHRIDRAEAARPYRCPTLVLALAAGLGYVNLAFMGAGADVWGKGTLRNGLIASLLILPIFAYRHYVQDRGAFPFPSSGPVETGPIRRLGGIYPYLAIVVGLGLILVTHLLATISF